MCVRSLRWVLTDNYISKTTKTYIQWGLVLLIYIEITFFLAEFIFSTTNTAPPTSDDMCHFYSLLHTHFLRICGDNVSNKNNPIIVRRLWYLAKAWAWFMYNKRLFQVSLSCVNNMKSGHHSQPKTDSTCFSWSIVSSFSCHRVKRGHKPDIVWLFSLRIIRSGLL